MTSMISRRAVLRGAGGALVALPWLEAMLPRRRAHAAAPVTRFVVFFQPGGNIRERWTPTGGENDFKLGEILAPLERHRRHLVVVDGLTMKSAAKGYGDGHQRPMGACTTGSHLERRAGAAADAKSFVAAGFPPGPSIDQRIAAEIGRGTKLRSIELGVNALRVCCITGGGGTPWDYISYAEGGKPLPAEDDPAVIYARLFRDFSPSGGMDPATQRRLAERRSVLDAIKESYTALAPRLGQDDRQKLEEHLTQIRGIEQQLTHLGTPAGAGCARPADPAGVPWKNPDSFPQFLAIQRDLMIMALACGLTRVATLQCGRAALAMVYKWLGFVQNHHQIQHLATTPQGIADQTKISLWYSEMFAEMLDKMIAVKEGDRTLLDNTLVFWTNEMGRGTHNWNAMPFLLAGSAGGALRTGRFLRAGPPPGPVFDARQTGMAHNALLVGCMNAMGIAGDTFGDPEFPGRLPGLL